MADLSVYKYKLDQKGDGYNKESSFDHLIIYSVKDFERWYSENAPAYSNGSYIFRGINEARYKLFTSLQKVWWYNDYPRAVFRKDLNEVLDYVTLVKYLLSEAKSWNNGTLGKFFQNFGTQLNDLSFLSLMQHYGLPTPLLDFTYDIDVALFFAFRNMTHNPSNYLIDNCVSLYIINLTDNADRFLEISALNEEFTIDELFAKEKLALFENLKEPDSNFPGQRNPNQIYYSPNIVNQQGLFVFNYHPWKPLDVSSIYNGHPAIKSMICVDIHKTLRSFVSNKLLKNDPQISEDYLFPSFDHFKAKTLETALLKFATNHVTTIFPTYKR